jgi:4-oxalocrotonate tautomerase
MPHISIKHFPPALNEQTKTALTASIVQAVVAATGCADGVVSVAIETVEPHAWSEQVYQPEIKDKSFLLTKVPNY